MTERLIIFADPGIGLASSLLDSFLHEIRRCDSVELIGVCDTGLHLVDGEALRHTKAALRRAARRLFDPETSVFSARGPSLYRVARRHEARVFTPPQRNVNSPEFLSQLRREQPTMGLSLGCLQIFGRPLLDVLGYAVNFHDGALPQYRGRLATAWSLYRRERYSGYAYHRMEEDVDNGPILEQGCVPVPAGATMRIVLGQKAAAASRHAGAVLTRMMKRDPGVSQAGGSYFSLRKGMKIRRLESPSALTAEEILHRLRSFQMLEIRLADQWYEVTSLRLVPSSSGLMFETCCGARLAVDHCLFLPLRLYRLYRWFHPAPRRVGNVG